MSAYSIVKGAALPSRAANCSKYPFAEMEIGDSFDAGEVDSKGRSRVGSAVYAYSKKHGVKFAIRHSAADKHLRVWRTA